MTRLQSGSALAGTSLCVAMLLLAWPQAKHAGALLDAQDDPAQLADVQISSALRSAPKLIEQNIYGALAQNDSDLAQSLVALAADKGIVLSDELKTRVAAAVALDHSPTQVAKRFATGLLTGNGEDAASLSGSVAGDLFVFGDVRDVVNQSQRLVAGEEPDRLILGLAAAGLAVTAATFVSIGGATPLRAGLTLVKDARKFGRLGAGLSRWAGRSARDVVDTPALRTALTEGALSKPAETVRAVKAAFRADKAGDLVRVAKDVGRIGDKLGTRGALDTLKIAEGPKDIARAARLAESKPGQTRGILKLLGRSALVLSLGAFNLSSWLLWVVFALFGVVSSIKAATERATWWWLRRRRDKRARRQAALAAAKAAAMPQLPPLPLAALSAPR
ncbi:hypothetical protein HNR60_004650 [Rhodopseudomonas rhenobacensis]|uniref:Uncharacterized protein n=1 Tax=Rhodopseudomonas rhenobacensis TaxID=87461 RepID=A0A7W8E2F7_9BRAD|nr:hypothetical protein [Rhodopseudomonas rhenobacensis]MBB5049866.1 hypothetical protein [Rhodopseudomonas rhenobacensis]